jgi:hypothetical protein
MSGSALPSDVRRWLCPADNSQIIPGLCPWFGLSPSDFNGPKAQQGHSPNLRSTLTAGQATASHPAAEPSPRATRALEALPPFSGESS